MRRSLAMAAADDFDRAAALKQFDESKTGVRGLVESGSAATTLPPIFRHPILRHRTSCPSGFSVPTVDLSLPLDHLVGVVAAAAREWGFFQIVNHGLSPQLIDGAVSAVRSFHELPPDERSEVYSRSMAGGVSYSSNVDLYQSVAASWRDTVQIMMGPTLPDPEQIPAVCRKEVLAFDEGAAAVAGTVMRLLSEGLDLAPERLEAALRLESRLMVCHYYPPCPEPEQTVGTAEHTDPGALTVLVQDSVGGLQVKWTGKDGDEAWVDVEPVPGAIVINVGDLLQMFMEKQRKSLTDLLHKSTTDDKHGWVASPLPSARSFANFKAFHTAWASATTKPTFYHLLHTKDSRYARPIS